MNVLQVINTYHPEFKFGGPPLKVHSLSKGLSGRGHALKVLAFDSAQRKRRDVAAFDGVAVQYLPWMGWGLRQWPTDRMLIAAAIEHADVVHCYGLYNALCPLAAKIAHSQNRPFLVEPLGMYQPRARNRMVKRIYHRLITHRLFRRASCIVATSPAEFDELKRVVGATRLVLRRNGIDVDVFQKLPAGNEFRKKFGIPKERIILYLGRISPIKNLGDLVRAFAKAALTNCRLVLAGPMDEADHAEKMRNLIQSLQLTERIVLPGALYDNDKLAALAAAELFVLPSLSESFGNAAAEAVAAGVPVLLTNTCGIAPLIHERAGLAVPLGVDSIANGLRVMMDESERRTALTSRRAEVLKELSWEEPLNQTEKLYAEILAASTNEKYEEDKSCAKILEKS